MRFLIQSLLVWLVVLRLAGEENNFNDLKRLYEYDVEQPLDVKEVLLYEQNNVNVYDVTYASPKGGRVTAYLVVPADKQPHAGLVFGHWGAGTRTEFLPEATLYARSGAVSLLVDNPWVRPAPWRKPLKQIADPDSDREAFIQAVVDLRRGIDLLVARPDVDAQRIAYVGHSYGAQWGAILSAVEDRLKAAVLMGGIPDQESIYRDGTDPDLIAFRANVPQDKQDAYFKALQPTAAVRYVPHSKIPLLFQFARYEQYFDQAAMDRYYAAAREPKEVKWYHAGHDLNDPAALMDRAAWLSTKLGLNSIRPALLESIDRR